MSFKVREEVKFLRIKGVIEAYSISRSTVYNLVNSESAPADSFGHLARSIRTV